jgi:hypothetical protein
MRIRERETERLRDREMKIKERERERERERKNMLALAFFLPFSLSLLFHQDPRVWGGTTDIHIGGRSFLIVNSLLPGNSQSNQVDNQD